MLMKEILKVSKLSCTFNSGYLITVEPELVFLAKSTTWWFTKPQAGVYWPPGTPAGGRLVRRLSRKPHLGEFFHKLCTGRFK